MSEAMASPPRQHAPVRHVATSMQRTGMRISAHA